MLTADTRIADWLQLIRAEYLEIPGLSLTKPQVQRLELLPRLVWPTSEPRFSPTQMSRR